MRSSFLMQLTRSFVRSILFLTGVMASPIAAAAQQSVNPIDVEARRATRQNEIADTLDAQALRLYAIQRKFFDAARLHRRAGQLRGADPRAIQSFRSASWMYSAAGDNGLARQMMEKAGEQATVVGDVEKAANAYIDAALFALADHDEDKVRILLGRVRAVAGSPLLTTDSRDRILARIGESTALAKVDATH